MKKLFLLAAIAGVMQGCNHVEQGLSSKDQDLSILCGNQMCYVTYAWVDMSIVHSWYDNPVTLTDSIKKLRRKQAQHIIDICK